MVSYDYYRIFYYVARCRSFTQAARELLSSQPNVTRAIKNLEAELGCTLLIRSHRGVTLTAEGEKLYEHVSLAVEQLSAGEELLAMDKGLQSGTVTIAATEIALRCLLLPVLKAFRLAYPGVRIRVLNLVTAQASEAIRDGLADFALVTGPAGEQPGVSAKTLRQFQEVAVCGPAYAVLAEKPVELHALTNVPMIGLADRTQTHTFYEALFERAGLHYAPEIEAATADQILPMVMANLGVGFVPEEFVRAEARQDSFLVLELVQPLPPRAILLLKRKGQSLSLAARALCQLLE